jgi:hypothetical protein
MTKKEFETRIEHRITQKPRLRIIGFSDEITAIILSGWLPLKLI